MTLLLVVGALAFGQYVAKPAHVRGRVTTLWGEPIDQAQVSFYKLEGISGISRTEKLVEKVTTDKNGNYKTIVPWGQYRVEVKTQGWANAEVWRYYLGEGDNGVLDIGAHQGNWHIIRRMKVAVLAKQPDGKPVPDATITMIPAYSYNEPQSFVSLQERTNDQGRYDFFPMEVGDFVVYAAKPGFLPGSAAFRVNNGEEKAVEIELTAAPPFDFFPWIKKPASK